MKLFIYLNILAVFSLNSLCQIQDLFGGVSNMSETVTMFDTVSFENTSADVLSSTQIFSGGRWDETSPPFQSQDFQPVKHTSWGNCVDFCGMANEKPVWQSKCYCDALCFVFNDCCDDVEETCPGLKTLANDTFGPDLMEAESVCDNETGVSVISGCPDTILDKSEDENLDIIRSTAYVFDQATGILYQNEKVFNCYASPTLSDPLVWDIELNFILSDIVNFTDVITLLNDDFAIKLVSPEDLRARGRQCMRVFPPKFFKFSMLFSHNPHSGIMNIFTFGETAWKNIECGKLGACKEKECALNAEIIDGKCVWFKQNRVFFLHPARVFPRDFMEELVSYIRCRLMDEAHILHADFRNIQQIVHLSEQPYYATAIQRDSTLFSFDVSITSKVVYSLKNIILKSSALFYRYKDIVGTMAQDGQLRYRSILSSNSQADSSISETCTENANDVCLKDRIIDLPPLLQLQKAGNNSDSSPVAFCIMTEESRQALPDENRCTSPEKILSWHCPKRSEFPPSQELPTARGCEILVCEYLPFLTMLAYVQEYY